MDSPARIGLIDPQTGERFVTFESGFSEPVTGLFLSVDGSRLVATAARQGVSVWDLAALRQGFREKGLNWKDPQPQDRFSEENQ